MVISTQNDSPLDSYAPFLQALNTLLYVIRSIKNRLIDIPASRLCRQVQYLIVILDRMGYPFLLQRDQCFEELLFPFVVLCKRVIDYKKAVIVYPVQLLNERIYR